MLKLVLLFSLLALELICDPLANRYELYANSVYTQKDDVIAEGGVIIYNNDSLFSADKIIYNQKSETLELIGNVFTDFDGSGGTKNNYLKINLKDKKYKGEKLFLFDNKSDIWVWGKSVSSKNGKYNLRNASISSCNVENPDWQFRFTKGFYNSKKEYISLNNPTFYIHQVPILYFPWIAFPTNTKRRTGLLRPHIGFENSENLLFVQPIFIAPDKNWDIELFPQLRLNRGLGLYGDFRFVDTNHSHGSLKVGIFDEQDDYAKEHKLKNNVHKGIEFKYKNNQFLSPYMKKKIYKDALLVDITNLNDIDFINLKHDSNYAVNKLITSKINYYMTNSDEYMGLYAKYFIDTEKLDNSDTLQTLPSFQYHKFTKELPWDGFLYSIDYKFKNSYRKKGTRAIQHELSLPITYNKSFFDEFVNFSATENLYYSRVKYHELNSSVADHANYFRNYHRFSLSSDLTKSYKDFTHNIQLDASYIIPSIDNKNGYFADFIPFNLEKKSIRLMFNEYLYNKEGFNFLTHRIKQNIYLENSDNKLDDLENELIYKFSKDFYINNTLIYSHQLNKLKKIQSGIYYNDNYNLLRLNHTYQDAPDSDDINYLTADFSRKIDRKYDVFAGIDYDFDQDFTKEWRLGWSMHKRCWDYKIRYSHNVTPSLTSGGTESLTRKTIYFYVKLANIGGVELKNERDYRLKNGDLENDIDEENEPKPKIDEEDLNVDIEPKPDDKNLEDEKVTQDGEQI